MSARLTEAENELKDAVDSVEKNFEGMRQPKAGGAFFNRPQEVVAAIQALAQAYNDYYGAVGDPAQLVAGQDPCGPVSPGGGAPPTSIAPGRACDKPE